jgi:hypothetical protein
MSTPVSYHSRDILGVIDVNIAKTRFDSNATYTYITILIASIGAENESKFI